MKKIFGILAVGMMILSSCGNSTPSADLKNKVDTLSYVMGMANTQGLEQYLIEALGVDSTCMDDVIKGIQDAVNAGDSKEKQAYYAGLQIGSQIKNQMFKGINRQLAGKDSVEVLNTNDFMSGFIAKVKKEETKLNVDSMAPMIQTMMDEVKATYMEKEFGKNKEAGEKFLKDNGKKAGVVTLPSGVQYKVLKAAEGVKPTKEQRVKVMYEGKTIDGKVFDSNWGKEPTTMGVGQVIPGFSEALQLMPVGSTWEIYIPQDKAYGSNNAGQIEPFSTLIFKVELKEIVED
ncbi:MAG: FKBP-type peptidyl-prolyl cis-trans isomerase [Prevotella sp.]|nr:FKBP-type peptidyl-prolyl cis-trans isomerase [Candidatus Equicola stercoris]